MTLKARPKADGRYYVPYSKAWLLTNASDVIAEDSGKPLKTNKRTLSLIGALFGAGNAFTLAAAGFIWAFVFGMENGGAIAAVAAAVVAVNMLGAAYATSHFVAFTPTQNPSTNA